MKSDTSAQSLSLTAKSAEPSSGRACWVLHLPTYRHPPHTARYRCRRPRNLGISALDLCAFAAVACMVPEGLQGPLHQSKCNRHAVPRLICTILKLHLAVRTPPKPRCILCPCFRSPGWRHKVHKGFDIASGAIAKLPTVCHMVMHRSPSSSVSTSSFGSVCMVTSCISNSFGAYRSANT